MAQLAVRALAAGVDVKAVAQGNRVVQPAGHIRKEYLGGAESIPTHEHVADDGMSRLDDDLCRLALEVLAAEPQLPIDAKAKRVQLTVQRQCETVLATGHDLLDVLEHRFDGFEAVGLSASAKLAKAAAAPGEEAVVTCYGKAVVAPGRYLLESFLAFDGQWRCEAVGAAALPALPFVVRRMLGDAAPGPDNAVVL